MSFRFLLLSVLTCAAFHLLPAQAPTAAENSLLWEITRPEWQDTSYLYGTIHIIPAESYSFSEVAQRAFDRSGRVAFEIDPREMSDPMALLPIMGKLMMPGDTTLADLLTPAQYDSVQQFFEDKGIPMLTMIVDRMKPMFSSMFAQMDMEDMQGGLLGGGGPAKENGTGLKSYELELSQAAEAARKPILGLETMEFQISLFDQIPLRKQAEMFMQSIQQAGGEGDDMMDEMVRLYTTQDIVAMVNMMDSPESGVQGMEDLLLNSRNAAWIPRMTKHMKDGPVFFAVGAGHLAGEQGVIALLRGAGYRVRAVR